MSDDIHRDTRPIRGAHFHRAGHRDMVTIVIDSRSSVGPIPVTDEHRRDWPNEWATYRDAQVREMIG